jgi:hypothetical protein
MRVRPLLGKVALPECSISMSARLLGVIGVGRPRAF